jgi:TPR repeat protein
LKKRREKKKMSLLKKKVKQYTSLYKCNTIYSLMKEQEILSTIINELNEVFIKEHSLGRTTPEIRNSLVKHIKLRKQSATKIYNHLLGTHEGKPELTCLLGWFNLRAIGTGTLENLDEAFNLFTKSASQNYALGQFYLAICYEQ